MVRFTAERPEEPALSAGVKAAATSQRECEPSGTFPASTQAHAPQDPESEDYPVGPPQAARPDGANEHELTPEQRRQRTLEALVSQMEALTRQNSVLMIFEDAHWTDPTSLEVFDRVVNRVRSHRVLLIVTFRSDFDAPWVGRPMSHSSPSIAWMSVKPLP